MKKTSKTHREFLDDGEIFLVQISGQLWLVSDPNELLPSVLRLADADPNNDRTQPHTYDWNGKANKLLWSLMQRASRVYIDFRFRH